MAEQLTLTATTGREHGTGPAKRLRAEDHIPGVVYGLGTETVEVSVAFRELRRVLTTDAGMNAIITLDIDGESVLSIVKDLQRHPVRRNPLHVDFLRVDPDATISVEVPIVLTGEAKNVEVGGYVDHVLYTLPIDAKPGAIPDELELDISDLEIGTSLSVADLTLPAGVSTEVDAEEAIVFGQASRVVEEEVPTEGEEGEEGEGEEGDGDGDGDGGDADGDDDDN